MFVKIDMGIRQKRKEGMIRLLATMVKLKKSSILQVALLETDAELKAKVNRLNMEKQYSDLTSADRGRGSYYLGNMLDIVGSVTAIGASAVGIAVAIRQLKK